MTDLTTFDHKKPYLDWLVLDDKTMAFDEMMSQMPMYLLISFG